MHEGIRAAAPLVAVVDPGLTGDLIVAVRAAQPLEAADRVGEGAAGAQSAGCGARSRVNGDRSHGERVIAQSVEAEAPVEGVVATEVPIGLAFCRPGERVVARRPKHLPDRRRAPRYCRTRRR